EKREGEIRKAEQALRDAERRLADLKREATCYDTERSHVEHRFYQRPRAHRRTGGHPSRPRRASDLRIGRARTVEGDTRMRRPAGHSGRSATNRPFVPRAEDSVRRARPRHWIVRRRASAP